MNTTTPAVRRKVGFISRSVRELAIRCLIIAALIGAATAELDLYISSSRQVSLSQDFIELQGRLIGAIAGDRDASELQRAVDLIPGRHLIRQVDVKLENGRQFTASNLQEHSFLLMAREWTIAGNIVDRQGAVIGSVLALVQINPGIYYLCQLFAVFLAIAGTLVLVFRLAKRRLISRLNAIRFSLQNLDIRDKAKVDAILQPRADEPNDEITWMLNVGRQLLVAAFAVVQERDREIEARISAEARMHDFFRASSDFFIEFDELLHVKAVSRSADAHHLLKAFVSAYGLPVAGEIPSALPNADPQWHELSRLGGQHQPFRNFKLRIEGRLKGTELIYSCNGHPHFDRDGHFKGVRMAVTDVTEIEIAQRTMEEERRFIDQAFNLLPSCLLVLDRDLNVLYANQPTANRYGLSIGEMVGSSFRNMVPPRFSREQALRLKPHFVAELLRHIETGQAAVGIERQIVWEGAEPETSILDIVPLCNGKGTVTGLMVVFTDISERKIMETDLRNAYSKLERQARDLEVLAQDYARERQMALAANRAKSDFLANMSHELRTPLNVVIGFSEVITKEMFGPVSPRYLSYANDILFSAKHLLSLISDILDMSKLEAGRHGINPEPCDLVEVFDATTRMLGLRAEKAGVSLVAELPDNLPMVIVDSRALRQVLINIVGNAIKFSNEGGRVLTIVDADERQGLLITVTDSGIGIRAEDQPRLFEPFWQGEKAHVKMYEGTGLGLSICRSLMDLHGGTIKIESQYGVGTKVFVRFPPDCIVAPDRGAAAPVALT